MADVPQLCEGRTAPRKVAGLRPEVGGEGQAGKLTMVLLDICHWRMEGGGAKIK
jgi:hypothetical protein